MAKITTGINKAEISKRRAEAHACAIDKIDNIKDDMEMYKLTKCIAYDNIKSAIKLMKQTHSYKMDEKFIKNIEYAIDNANLELAEHYTSIIFRDLKAILNYNEALQKGVEE